MSFDLLPHKISQKILEMLPLEAKKKGRRVCKEWNRTLLLHLTFRIPEFNDVTARNITSFTQEITEITITSLILPIPMTLNFFNGHRIRTLKFEDAEITEDNMVWLMTKCYSIKEIRISQKKSYAKLAAFLASKNARIMNMASRTLKAILISGYHQGNPPANECTKDKLSFDCAILRDCISLQSFIIINLPLLELRNIQQLPSSLAHLALEEEGGSGIGGDGDESPAVTPSSPTLKLVSLGFIDFSSPIPLPVKTFQYVIRLTRLRRLTMCPLSGQKLLDSCQTARMFSALWSSEINHYQVRTGFRTIQSVSACSDDIPNRRISS